MCPEWMISNAEDDGFEHFCPVSRTMPNIEMIGVARLRYRSHTSRTAAWYDQLQHTGGKWVEEYQDLEARARTSRAAKRA
jgi:hypothetical protein